MYKDIYIKPTIIEQGCNNTHEIVPVIGGSEIFPNTKTCWNFIVADTLNQAMFRMINFDNKVKHSLGVWEKYL